VRIQDRNKEFITAFGGRIRQLRVERGWSQYEFSYKSNLERSFIRKLENGTVNTGIAILPELAEVFEIPIVELLHFDYPKDTSKE